LSENPFQPLATPGAERIFFTFSRSGACLGWFGGLKHLPQFRRQRGMGIALETIA
jgi:hypothetical protein